MRRILEVAIGEFFGKKSKAGKPRLAQGSETNIDEVVTIRIRGTVKKAKDTTRIPTTSIPLKVAMALLLEKAGYGREAQRQEAMHLLIEAMTEALEDGWETNDSVAERIKDIDKAMERVQSGLAQLPPVDVNGAVKVNVTVEELPATATNLVGTLV